MTSRTSIRPTVAAVSASVILTTLGGCGSGSEPAPDDDRIDPEAMAGVATDDDATLEEIVEAGSALDADYAADGSALVIYQVVDGSGPEREKQSAWRLYDPDGEQVTQGRSGGAAENSLDGGVLGLDDGFVLATGGRNILVGSDGDLERVPAAQQRLRIEPGDVRYRGRGGSMFRPEEPVIFLPAPPDPEEAAARGWTIDDTGRRWLQTADPEAIHRTTGGDGWERVRDVELEDGEYLLEGGVTVIGDKLAVPVAERLPGSEDVRITTIAARRLDALRSGPWRYLDAGPFADGEWSATPVVFAPDDSTMVISDWQRGTHRFDIGTGEWSQIPHPTEAEHWEIEPGRGGLFAFHGERRAARFSDDWGETWSLLPR